MAAAIEAGRRAIAQVAGAAPGAVGPRIAAAAAAVLVELAGCDRQQGLAGALNFLQGA